MFIFRGEGCMTELRRFDRPRLGSVVVTIWMVVLGGGGWERTQITITCIGWNRTQQFSSSSELLPLLAPSVGLGPLAKLTCRPKQRSV